MFLCSVRGKKERKKKHNFVVFEGGNNNVITECDKKSHVATEEWFSQSTQCLCICLCV